MCLFGNLLKIKSNYMKFKSLVITAIILFSGCQTTDSNTLNSNFVHVVYFWLHNPDNADDRKEFESALKTFIGASEYAKTKFVGVPAMTDREVVDNSYTYSLILSFNSKEEQDKYQAEPVHVKFVEDAQHLWRKVQVYDSLGN